MSTGGAPFPFTQLHVAIIMDGNGRWAAARGLAREAGHSAGAAAVRRTVEAACSLGVGWLTLYAFSSDNWLRPAREVSTLLKLFGDYLRGETETCVKHGVRLGVIGRRDRLGADLLSLVLRAESETRQGNAMRLRLAIDYSSRDAILDAARRIREAEEFSREDFKRLLGGNDGDGASAAPSPPDVDLLIRTGGEQRLSDFLLWESAYAEIVFTRAMWPDFGRADLEAALREFLSRDRRFGRIHGAAAGS